MYSQGGNMEEKDAAALLSEGIRGVDEGNMAEALVCFDKIAGWMDDYPIYSSYRGVCLAGERGDVEEGIRLCRYAMELEPKKSVHYLNLGRIHLTAGRKPEALRIFRDGLLYERNGLILSELERLGRRKIPAFPSLGREHPVNRCLGRISRKLGLR
jgi:tetratricopeptide (TPR) repeat protein